LDLDAKNFYYDNPLVAGRPRYPWHACPCCVGNIPRTLLMVPTWTYVKGKDGIYVNLFIGSKINAERVAGTDVQMVQKTDYPWSGKVAITVNPKETRNFTVFVRVPNRQTSELYKVEPQVSGLKSVALNGKQVVNFKTREGYLAITRDWKAGDTLEVEFPMDVQRVTADERIAADRGMVALRCGPLIYNVERADQADINQPIGPGPLRTEWRGDLLHGVNVIKGSWSDGSPLVAVPNFVRCNRLDASRRSSEASGGDASVNYAPGSSTGPTATNAPAQGRRRGFGEPSSVVWIKDKGPVAAGAAPP